MQTLKLTNSSLYSRNVGIIEKDYYLENSNRGSLTRIIAHQGYMTRKMSYNQCWKSHIQNHRRKSHSVHGLTLVNPQGESIYRFD